MGLWRLTQTTKGAVRKVLLQTQLQALVFIARSEHSLCAWHGMMTSLDQMKHVKSIKEAQPRDWKDIETRQCPLARIHVSDSNSLSNAKNPMQTRSYDSHPPLNSNPLNSNRKLLSDQFPACPVIFQTLQRNVPREDRDGLWILSDLPKHFSSGHREIPSANQDLGPSIVSDVNLGVLLGYRAFSRGIQVSD